MPEMGMFFSNQKGAEIRFYYTFYRKSIFYKIKLQFSMGSSVL